MNRNEILVIVASIIAAWVVFFRIIPGLIDWRRRREMKKVSAAPPPPKNKYWSKEARPNEFLKLGARGVPEAAVRRKGKDLLILGGSYATWKDVPGEKKIRILEAEAMWRFDPQDEDDQAAASNRVSWLDYHGRRTSDPEEAEYFEQELALTLVFLLRVYGEKKARSVATKVMEIARRPRINELYTQLIEKIRQQRAERTTRPADVDEGYKLEGEE